MVCGGYCVDGCYSVVLGCAASLGCKSGVGSSSNHGVGWLRSRCIAVRGGYG